ncbi:MAG: hypothetical protein JWQ79_2496 [Mucilaginibacter sp.]|nr:hypothetical protein [Mucilaginibacter sp.]
MSIVEPIPVGSTLLILFPKPPDMNQPQNDQSAKSERQLYSIIDIYTMHKTDYINRNRSIWLFRLHMVILFSWLFIRYGVPLVIGIILQPIITYFKDLIAEQDGSLWYKKPLKRKY